MIMLLSLATNHYWPLSQFDVKSACLHGNIEKKIFMDVPHGFEG